MKNRISVESRHLDFKLVDRNEWDRFIDSSEESTIYQTSRYAEIRWGENSIFRFLLERKSKAVVGCQIAVKRFSATNVGFAYCAWGPIFRSTDERNQEITDVLIQKTVEFFPSRAVAIRFRPFEYTHEKGVVQNALQKAGFLQNNSKDKYSTLLLSLDKDLATIRKSLRQKWRSDLNRAERNQLQVKESTSDEDFHVFLELQAEMQSRKRYSTSIDYLQFKKIHAALPGNQKLRIFSCYKDGVPISSAILSALGKTGIYLLGASGQAGRKQNAAYLLQWRIIEYLKKQNFYWYDLGGIDKIGNPGVYHFKSGISAKEVWHTGAYDLSRSFLSKMILRMA